MHFAKKLKALLMLWKQAWEAPSSVAVAVAVSCEHLLSLAVVLVALVAGWRSKLPLQMHLLPLAVVLVVVVAGARGCSWGRNSEFEPVLALANGIACAVNLEDCGVPLEKRQQPILGQALLQQVAKPTRGAHCPDKNAHGLSDMGAT